MRFFKSFFGIIIFLLFGMACNPIDPDPGPDPDIEVEADITLDELLDMEVYAKGVVVDCRYLKEQRTNRILVNDSTHNAPVTLDLTGVGYYRIEIFLSTSGDETPHVIRMVVLDPERGQTEWGLPVWTPKGVTAEVIVDQEIQLVHPTLVPVDVSFPLVAIVDGELTKSIDNLSASVGSSSFLIKRGSGSVWVSPSDPSSDKLKVNHRTFPIQTTEMAGPALSMGGILGESTLIPSGSYVNIVEDLTIPKGITLTIGTGVFVTIDPEVNIYNDGRLRIEGSKSSPVTLTCSNEDAYWGGIVGKAPGNQLEASHTIFCRSGHHNGVEYDWGHAHRQSLFYTELGSLSLNHCYMIDHIGQVFYPVSASLEIDYCLVQRALTGGQLNNSQVSINHSVFTDFPDDSNAYQDQDNDALYLIECKAVISNSVFMYAKDDGLDSGGSTGGEVTVRNTRFESIFHEGAALSGGWDSPKRQNFYNCTFIDCGQGLELGFSSSDHMVTVDSSLFHRNGIGIRYGDNYSFSNNGYIKVSNTQSIENRAHDIWNMDREDWVADTAHMEFDNVWVTKANPMYPQLKIFK